jgi:hypothetical protein
MNIVKILFRPEFKDALLSGRKICTARSKPMGAAGDRFQAFGAWFDLKRVEDVALWEVKSRWEDEGCESPEHFVEVWNSIHPKVKYQDYNRVYLHEFKKVERGRPNEEERSDWLQLHKGVVE